MLINNLKEKAKLNKKRIILPESSDKRILEATNIVLKEDLADIILIGEENNYTEYPFLNKAMWINPNDDILIGTYAESLYQLRKDKGLTKEEARNLLVNDYMYLACMLLLDNKADGIVSGICHSTSNTLRPALQLIKGKEELVSSFFIMEKDDKVYLFSDCGLNQNPSSEELAIIAKQSIKSYEQLIGENPKTAFLSHSTYGSSKHIMVDKVKLASEIAKQNNPTYLIDGEMQLDAAIIPEVANIKCPNSPLKGEANILIFPDLDSGNIGYKLVERLAGYKAYGPITQGLNKPVNDLSRGSSIDDIIGVIVITSLQV